MFADKGERGFVVSLVRSPGPSGMLCVLHQELILYALVDPLLGTIQKTLLGVGS